MSSLLTVIYEFNQFRIDRANQRLTRDGMLLVTPGKTLPILLDLIEHREQVVSIEKLVGSHFPKSPSGDEDVTREILVLKRLMGDTADQAPVIRFLFGQGYQFDAAVTEYIGDADSGGNFGSKSRTPEAPPAPLSVKPKSQILGILGVVVAIGVIGFGVWKFMPRGSGGENNRGSETAEFTGTPQVAILPFQSLTGQAGDEGFNKSLADGLFAALSKQRGVKVVPRAEVQKYLESGVSDPVSAGRQLGAQLIVHGMAQRLAGQIAVKVQLVNTQDGSQLWSTNFEGGAADIAGISEQISRKIVGGK